MKKSTKVKNTRTNKTSTSPKMIRKFKDGGRNILKEFTDPGLKGYQGADIEDVKTSSESAAVPVDNKTVITENKVATPKAKLLPGGFTSEAQKAAYTRNLKLKVKSGMTADDLVKKGFGTKKGLTDLGVYNYEKGLAMKKEGQANKKLGEAKKTEGNQNKKAGQEIKAKGAQIKGKGKDLAVKGRKEVAGSSINTYLTSSKKSGFPIEMTADGFAVTKKNVSKKGDKTIVVESYDKKGNITKYARKYVPADPNKKTTYREVKNEKGAKLSGFDNPGMRSTLTGRTISGLSSIFSAKSQDQIKAGTVDKKNVFNALKADENDKYQQKGLDGSGTTGWIMPTAIAKAGQGAKYTKAINDFFKKNPGKTVKEAQEAVKKSFTEWAKSGTKKSAESASSNASRVRPSQSKLKNLVDQSKKSKAPKIDDVLAKGEKAADKSTKTRSEWLKAGNKKVEKIDEVLAKGEKGASPKFSYKKPSSTVKSSANKAEKVTPSRVRPTQNKLKDLANKKGKVNNSSGKKFDYKRPLNKKELAEYNSRNKAALENDYAIIENNGKFKNPIKNVLREAKKSKKGAQSTPKSSVSSSSNRVRPTQNKLKDLANKNKRPAVTDVRNGRLKLEYRKPITADELAVYNSKAKFPLENYAAINKSQYARKVIKDASKVKPKPKLKINKKSIKDGLNSAKKGLLSLLKSEKPKQFKKGGVLKITPTKPVKKTVTRKVSKK